MKMKPDKKDSSQLDKVSLNNFIVGLKKTLENARGKAIQKLKKSFHDLDTKKVKNKTLELKNQRKKDRFLEELNIYKKYSAYDLSKLLLLNYKTYKSVAEDPKSCAMEKAICRLADDNKINSKVVEFRAQYPNSEKEISILLKGLGVLHRVEKVKKLKREGKLTEFLNRENEIYIYMKDIYGADIDTKLLKKVSSIKSTKNPSSILPEINLLQNAEPKLTKKKGLKVEGNLTQDYISESESEINDEELSSHDLQGSSSTNYQLVEVNNDATTSPSMAPMEITSIFNTVESDSDEESSNSSACDEDYCSEDAENDNAERDNLKQRRKMIDSSRENNIANVVAPLRIGQSEVRRIDLKIANSDENLNFDEVSPTNFEKDIEEETFNLEGNESSFFIGRKCQEEESKEPSVKLNIEIQRKYLRGVKGEPNRRERRILEGRSLSRPYRRGREARMTPKDTSRWKREENKPSEQKELSTKRYSNESRGVKREMPDKSHQYIDPNLHPSWAAKKKEACSILPFQGKKIKFDDDI